MKRQSIFILFLVITTFSVAQSKREKIDDAILTFAKARTTTNQTTSVNLYAQAARHFAVLSQDSATLIINEGLAAAKAANIANYDYFLLQYYQIQLKSNNQSRDKTVQDYTHLLPFSYTLRPRARTQLYYQMADQYRALTKYDSAIQYFDSAWFSAIHSHDTVFYGSIVAYKSYCYEKALSHEKASELIEEFLVDYPGQIDNRAIMGALATNYSHSKRYQDLLTLYNKILRAKGWQEVAVNHNTLVMHYCSALLGLRKFTEAENEIVKHIKFYKTEGTGGNITGLYQHYAWLLKETGDYKKSLEMMDSSYVHKLSWMSKTYLARYHKHKSICYSQLGNADSAVSHLELFEKYTKEYYEGNAEKEYAKSLALYETKEKEQEIALLEKGNEIERAKTWKFRYLFIGSAIFLLVGALLVYGYLKRRRVKYQKALIEAELTSIRSQMNPHFMFNALNSVKSYIVKNDSRSAAKYLGKFASLMRGILDLSSKPFVHLQEELDTLQLYVDMEELRFKNQFIYTLDVARDVMTNTVLVPPLFLQPFIENAIKHGLTPLQDRQGELTLNITKEQDYLLYKVKDNGVGRSDQKASLGHKSKGMDISLKRISMLNAKVPFATSIDIVDLKHDNGESAGTEVIIKLAIKTSIV